MYQLRSKQVGWLLAIAVLAIGVFASTRALTEEIHIAPDGVTFVDRQRVDRYYIDYTYRFIVTNKGTSDALSVTGRVISSQNGVEILDGDHLEFGDMAPGDRSVSSNHFRVRVDRRTRPDISELELIDIVGETREDPIATNKISDSDGDGLPDDQEARLGLDPLLADTDSNGVPDGSEDNDGDGIANLAEINGATDPGQADTDGDGIPDGSEIANGLDPLKSDSQDDNDGDGLSNGHEVRVGSDPNSADSDADGRNDRQELVIDGTDPVDRSDVGHPIALTNGIALSDQGRLAVDDKGNLHVVWIDGRHESPGTSHTELNGEVYYKMISHEGDVLIDEARLSRDSACSRRPAIAIDNAGRVTVVWESHQLGKQQILLTRLEPALHPQDGSVPVDGDIVLVDDMPLTGLTEIEQRQPRLAVDARDQIHVVWEESMEAGGTVSYMQVSPEGNIDIEKNIDFDGDSERSIHTHPALAVDSFGDIHVVFNRKAGTCATEIYYTMLAGDTGDSIIEPTLLTDDDCVDSRRPTIGIDGDNVVAVVFEDSRFGVGDVFFRRAAPAIGDFARNAVGVDPLLIVQPDTLLSEDQEKNSILSAAGFDQFGNIHVTYYDELSDESGSGLLFKLVESNGRIVQPEVPLTEGGSVGAVLSAEAAGAVAVDGPTSFITYTDVSGTPPQNMLRILHPDSDRDGLSNAMEREFGSAPSVPDSDGDGLPDGFEAAMGFDPTDPQDAALDSDGDGLSNIEEFENFTDLDVADTDGDGFTDGEEVASGSDPRERNYTFPDAQAWPSVPEDTPILEISGAVEHHTINSPDRMLFEVDADGLDVKSPLVIEGVSEDAALLSGTGANSTGGIKIRPKRRVEIRDLDVIGRASPMRAVVYSAEDIDVLLENVTVSGIAENGIMLGGPDLAILRNVWIDGNDLKPHSAPDHCAYFTGRTRPEEVQIYGGAAWSCPVHAYKTRAQRSYFRDVHMLGSGNGAILDFQNGGIGYLVDVVFELRSVGTHDSVPLGVDGERTGTVRVIEFAPDKGPDPRVIQYGKIGNVKGDTAETDTYHHAPAALTLVNPVVRYPEEIEPQFRNDLPYVTAVIRGADTILPENTEFRGKWKCQDVPGRNEDCSRAF